MPKQQTRRERIADLVSRINAQNQSICERYEDATDQAEKRQLASRSCILLRRFGRLSRSASNVRRYRP